MLLEGFYGEHGGVGGVAVVGTAAAVELAVADDWRGGAEALLPALERRLFVEVPVVADCLW